ncbi:MAG TPA: hypothetical protein VLM89_04345 [Phycisphaerae bacterium]|nr:hypothetical protein [Phycisphaerae bacterium]
MIDLLATIFINPLTWDRRTGMLLLLPLCLAISVVYKTIKSKTLNELPMAILASWLTILLGMFAVGVALLLIYRVMA